MEAQAETVHRYLHKSNSGTQTDKVSQGLIETTSNHRGARQPYQTAGEKTGSTLSVSCIDLTSELQRLNNKIY